jgi:hypothetical protein
MAKFFNVYGEGIATGKVTHELIAPGVNIEVKSITIAANATSDISLFIENNPLSGATSRYFIIKNIIIPYPSTLVLDNPSILKFSQEFGLYMKVSSSSSLDVIIN